MLNMVHRDGKEYPDMSERDHYKVIDRCDDIDLWDIRTAGGVDDNKYDYGDEDSRDNGWFDYPEEGGEYPRNTPIDFDGNADTEEDYDLNEMADIEDPDNPRTVDIDGGDQDEGELDFREEYDFNQLLYGMPDVYVNVCALAIWQLARTLEDEVIKAAKDYKARYKICKNMEPAADAYLHVHVAVNPRTHKLYIEWLQNHRLMVLMGENRDRLDEMLRRHVVNFFNLSHKEHLWRAEIILPEDNHTLVCDSTYLLTPYTVAYWRSFHDKFMFLEDREEVKQDLLKRQIEAQHNGQVFSKQHFFDEILKINRDYGMDETSHQRIPEVMDRYKELYQEETDVILPDLYEAYLYIAIKYGLDSEDKYEFKRLDDEAA